MRKDSFFRGEDIGLEATRVSEVGLGGDAPVASAPNAQGLFADDQSGERPKTAELGKEPLVAQGGIANQSKGAWGKFVRE